VEKWRKTVWFDKSSTLASCRGQRNLLSLFGFETADESDDRFSENDAFQKIIADPKNKSMIDMLARNEHFRWMAFMRTHGVLPWDLVSPDMGTVKNISNQIKANCRIQIGRHAAIVAYDELPTVNYEIAKFINPTTDATKEDYIGRGSGDGLENNLQWNDIKFIYWIPELTQLCGKKIVKIKS
jgi:hypothetical protein